MIRLAGAALAASTMFAGTAAAQSQDARNFGARESVMQMSLAPDGKHVAMIQPLAGRGAALVIGATDGSGTLTPILQSSGNPDRLRECRWSTATRLVCTIYIIDGGDADRGMTRMIAVDADGKNLKELSARSRGMDLGLNLYGGEVIDWLPEEQDSAVLMDRFYVPEQQTGTMLGQKREGLGVDRVDTVTLKRSLVEAPRPDSAGYITDGHGNVRLTYVQPRLATGYSGNRLVYSYRQPGSRDWKDLGTATIDGQRLTGFLPLAVDRELNLAYGLENQNGHTALYTVALDGSLRKTLVYGRDDVDVDGLVRIGRQQRVVGVTFATDKRETAFFDPKLKSLAASLSRALPGLPLVSFVDASADESKLLLFAGSDVDPGRYFLMDRATKQLAEVAPVRPDLAGTKLAQVKPVQFPAADGTMIPGYLTLPAGSDGKGLPAIVMPHGGPSARDEWGFDWLAQFFAARGYAVLQPNFRGSAGYGDAWYRDNGFKSWRTVIGDVNDSGKWLVAQGIAAPGKLAIFGWSYGGYAALQSPALDPNLFKAIVAVAPVTDLAALRDEHRTLSDYRIVAATIGDGPHVTEGSPAQNVARIRAPVLLFHGDQDLNVSIGESRLMASRMKAAGKEVELVEFNGLDHQLEDGKARAQLLDRSDAFIRAALDLPPRP